MYWQTIGAAWLFLAILFAVWIDASRGFDLPVFVPPSGTGSWLGASVAAVAVVLMLIAGHRTADLAQAERDEITSAWPAQTAPSLPQRKWTPV